MITQINVLVIWVFSPWIAGLYHLSTFIFGRLSHRFVDVFRCSARPSLVTWVVNPFSGGAPCTPNFQTVISLMHSALICNTVTTIFRDVCGLYCVCLVWETLPPPRGEGSPKQVSMTYEHKCLWHFKVLVLFRTLTSLVQPGFLHVGITWGVVDRVFPREQPQVAFSIGCGRVHSAHGLQGHLLRLRRPPRLRRWQVERGLGRTTLCPFHRLVTYFVAYFSVQLPNPQGCGHEACPWGMGLTCWGFS